MRNSKWFKEGYEAAKTDDGKAVVKCPYLDRTPKFYIWNEGFTAGIVEGYGKVSNTQPEQPQ